MTEIRVIRTWDGPLLADLSNLLIDAVDGGASVGFLAPLSARTAALYWERTCASIGGSFHLWAAECDGEIVGSVQLAVCEKENGRHRAEIQKLLVHRSFRGRGIASALMQAAEDLARSIGCTLLVLDTEAGSLAESVYRHLGWQKVGEIPDYAGRPDGTLIATAYYYKRIER